MKNIKKVYLTGLGAVGSAFASRLFEMDPGSISVIADKERIERYTGSKIIINGKPYPFNYVLPEEGNESADLIIVAVKQHHLEQAIENIRKFVGSDTTILSLLNGIVSEEIIGREFGMDKMLYSFCVGTDAVREGTSTSFTNIGKIVYGEKENKTYSVKVEAVKALFEKANIPYSIPADMIRELWWKFMMNVGINQTSAVLRATYGVFSRVDEAMELLKSASHEVACIAKIAGINLSDDDINEYAAIIKTLSPDGKTSMFQDVEAHRKTEVEIFSGTVIELGKKYGVETPVNNILFKMIRTLEKTY